MPVPLTPERFHAPLYTLPDEPWSPEPRDYTVTIAGPDRWDGEPPYTYVLKARSREQAWALALAWHIARNLELDSYVDAAKSHADLPSPSARFHWNDLRPQQERDHAHKTLLEQASQLVGHFNDAAARYVQNSEVRQSDQTRYDELRAHFGEEALTLLESLAAPADAV